MNFGAFHGVCFDLRLACVSLLMSEFPSMDYFSFISLPAAMNFLFQTLALCTVRLKKPRPARLATVMTRLNYGHRLMEMDK
jgi:hypothetical protein